jgi:ribokinase
VCKILVRAFIWSKEDTPLPPRITVVGSYATGLTLRVKRLPSRGQTVLASGYRADYGGKGSNQAVGCARLGAHVDFVASIGKDDFGAMALCLYREEGIDTRYVQQTPSLPTGVGFILVDADGHNCIALDPGANESLSPSDVTASKAAFQGTAVILTQLEIPVEAAEAALALGRAEGSVTILNPAPVRPLPATMLRSVDVLTPNQTEANVLTGRRPDAASDPEAVAGDLIIAGARQVVMTLGERGALIVAGNSTQHVPAPQMPVVDTTGAGDAFNAGLATALACGETLGSAVEFAVVTGALAVTRAGVIPALPTRQEVMNYYQERHLPAPSWLTEHAANRHRVIP